jgi:hypothetical protein
MKCARGCKYVDVQTKLGAVWRNAIGSSLVMSSCSLKHEWIFMSWVRAGLMSQAR